MCCTFKSFVLQLFGPRERAYYGMFVHLVGIYYQTKLKNLGLLQFLKVEWKHLFNQYEELHD